jgi:hypothetical protein
MHICKFITNCCPQPGLGGFIDIESIYGPLPDNITVDVGVNTMVAVETGVVVQDIVGVHAAVPVPDTGVNVMVYVGVNDGVNVRVGATVFVVIGVGVHPRFG